MSDEINFKSWNVNPLSDDGFEKVRAKAGQRRASRRKNRRIAAAAFGAMFACVLSAIVYFEAIAPGRQVASVKDMIEKEMRDHRDCRAYAAYDAKERKDKEERHEILVHD